MSRIEIKDLSRYVKIVFDVSEIRTGIDFS